MAERLITWLSRSAREALAWFDGLDGWLQFVVIVCVALVVVGAAHLDDLKRDREWRLFRLWLEERRRAGVVRLPRGMR
jgi:hypothetical protein